MKYDMENLLDDVEKLLRDNLNTKLAAVEAEKVLQGKGLDPALKLIGVDAFYRQSWNNKILQFNPAVFFGVESIRALDGGGEIGEEFKIFAEVIFADNGQSNDADKRIARYSRAIKEVFAENFDQVTSGLTSRFKIETVVPASFMNENTSEEMKIGGVQITTSLY